MQRGAGGAPETIVVGGGFAGLSAATLLAERGARVLLLEARPHLGGRARSWVDPQTGSTVDNGQHLLLGCYRHTLDLLDRLGSREGLDLQPRLRVPFVEPGGSVSVFALPPLPFFTWSRLAGLLRFPGLGFGERLGLLRVAREVGRLSRHPAAGQAGDLDEVSVSAWLRALGQSTRAGERLWHPLATAALNEEPDRASAAMFLPVLRELFLSGPGGSRLGVPRVGLSDLYAEPASHYLRARGSEVRLRAQVRQLLFERGRCGGVLLADGGRLTARDVIVAVPPDDLLEMLPEEVASDPFFAGCSRLQVSPIVSIYLWFGAPITDLRMAGLIGGQWQWIFSRHAHGGGAGFGVTLVQSAARLFVEASRDALVRRALDDLHRFFPASRRAALRHSLIIKEKRASMAPLPGTLALRPSTRTPRPGLHLAGDWTATGLPATIEGAVLSGHACARQVLDSAGPA